MQVEILVVCQLPVHVVVFVEYIRKWFDVTQIDVAGFVPAKECAAEVVYFLYVERPSIEPIVSVEVKRIGLRSSWNVTGGYAECVKQIVDGPC